MYLVKVSLALFLIASQLISSLMGQEPFRYGVASGDPEAEGVLLWTHVSVADRSQKLRLTYQVAQDSLFQTLVREGYVATDSSRDFTVKVWIEGLAPGETYFYRFDALGQKSGVGRTRTAVQQAPLHFAVVSCNNYEQGYFRSFGQIAALQDLQAVIHLGDYIYESYDGAFKSLKRKDRMHTPTHELLTLQDYRQRYAQYRADPDLQAAHARHPFIVIWDDHETSNNSFKDGADNHDPETEGEWEQRLNAAKQAYFEWMPIRETPQQQIYRELRFGNLAQLILLDTRIAGRDEQIYDMENDSLFAADRSILGAEQYLWLEKNLRQERQATWKLLANQVIFSPFYVGHIDKNVENLLLDIWDGYPAERRRLTEFIQEKQLENVVFLTGDFHCSMAFEVPEEDWNFPIDKHFQLSAIPQYQSVAVEYVVPSISSYNFDELLRVTGRAKGPWMANFGAKLLEKKFAKAYQQDKTLSLGRRQINPHLKWNNLRHHGYMKLSVWEDRVESRYYLLRKAYKAKQQAKLKASFYTPKGEARVIENKGN